jgi:hypothetical protein
LKLLEGIQKFQAGGKKVSLWSQVGGDCSCWRAAKRAPDQNVWEFPFLRTHGLLRQKQMWMFAFKADRFVTSTMMKPLSPQSQEIIGWSTLICLWRAQLPEKWQFLLVRMRVLDGMQIQDKLSTGVYIINPGTLVLTDEHFSTCRQV